MINDWKRLAWEAPNLSHSLTTKYTPYACNDDDDDYYYHSVAADAPARLPSRHSHAA